MWKPQEVIPAVFLAITHGVCYNVESEILEVFTYEQS